MTSGEPRGTIGCFESRTLRHYDVPEIVYERKGITHAMKRAMPTIPPANLVWVFDTFFYDCLCRKNNFDSDEDL